LIIQATSNLSWLKNVRTLQEANNRCSEMVLQSLPMLKSSNLDRPALDLIIKETVCFEILTHHEVEHQINKKLYQELELAIKKFAQYKKALSHQNENDAVLFKKWTAQKENFTFKNHEKIILQRLNQIEQKRIPASLD
jgi:hypothetical protein